MVHNMSLDHPITVCFGKYIQALVELTRRKENVLLGRTYIVTLANITCSR